MRHVAANPLALPVTSIPSGDLYGLKNRALRCQACPLWEFATHTVFGKGKHHATLMLVGEQPGEREDREGVPFVGPAGALLDRALEEAELKRSEVYLTNVVKHFKFERRGSKTRLHKRASAAEQAICRRWLAAEILQLRPAAVIALGAMAAQTLFGRGFRIIRDRGQWMQTERIQGVATWHPSAILRAKSAEGREDMFQQLVQDLQQARQHIDQER
jgi:uracil-DNA glycosylase